MVVHPKIIARAMPAMPRKGANLGTGSSTIESAMVEVDATGRQKECWIQLGSSG